jgi:hypothetical protein
MPPYMNRGHRVPTVFAPDTRAGADAFVYCKGCGHQLAGELRHQERREVINVMMCESCRQLHGHQLAPPVGAPSFCYRCGSQEEIFIEQEFAPVTHHLCPRCMPDRVARYRAGDFIAPAPVPPPVEAEKA